jgi:glycine hydroxymethyltransferase
MAGLIAEGRFQAPLAEGADLMTFSTYKSFGGPPGGAIVTSDPALAERVATAAYPGLTANYDASRLLPLLGAVLEHERSAGAYADQCIANAAALARGLDAAGFAVLGAARGFTASHHVALDARPFGGGHAAALALAAAGILLSEIGIPATRFAESLGVSAQGPELPPLLGPDAEGGLRFGTQAVTRQGFTEDDMPAIADACAAVLLRGERPDVAAIRRRHTGLHHVMPYSGSA